MKKISMFTLFFLAAFSLSANSQNLSIQDRLKMLEQQSGGNANAGDLVIQIQQLQGQIAQLQGTLEEQNHQIEKLKERQKVLYVDMDSRLTHIEQLNKVSVPANNELTVDSAANENTDSVKVIVEEVEVREPIDAELTTNTLSNSAVSSQNDSVDPAIAARYQDAFNQLKQGRFNESARAFEDFIQTYPNHQLTDNAYYWLGESYYVTRKYPLALAAFQNLKNNFPLSSKLADALLKIGYTYHELEDYQQAQAALEKVIQTFPNGSEARLAQNRLNLLKREGKIN